MSAQSANNGRKGMSDPSRNLREKKLSAQLRRMYDDVINEDVPDDFMKLLEEADDVGSDD